jgi:hypothetical protein
MRRVEGTRARARAQPREEEGKRRREEEKKNEKRRRGRSLEKKARKVEPAGPRGRG